jgi:hypothetical protein
MVLDLKDKNIYNIAIDVGNFASKNFRTEYDNPVNRLRKKILH